jgi:transcriptional regulator with XRE-family HTH domain
MYLKRLRDLREDIDAKLVTIANVLKITRQQYSLYELGKRDIPAEYIKILAKYYNTSSDYILELTDEIKPYKKK